MSILSVANGEILSSVRSKINAIITKINGIADNATANNTDAFLLARANHTGEQAISTITNLQSALDARPVVGAVISGFTSRALTNADFDAVITPTNNAQTVTVNTGLATGFGATFNGMVAFNGTATIVDIRTVVTSNPFCAMVNIGTNTYEIVGTRL